MYKIGSLTWTMLFKLTFMSQLYKRFACELTVSKIGNGLDQMLYEKQQPDMTTGNSELEGLIHRGLPKRPFSKLFTASHKTIAVKSEHVGDDVSEFNQQSMWASFQMTKETFMRDAASERKRRHSAGQQTAGSECQRHPMNVSFAKLGWNILMIAPSGYNAYYCAGECPLLLVNFNSTKHAQIQSFMSGYNPKIPKPCCVPTKLSSMQLIYASNSNTYNEKWNEMIVEACGCL